MKSIILFFTLVFLLLGGAVFFYETQIAAPRAGAILKKQASTPSKPTKAPSVKTKPDLLVSLNRRFEPSLQKKEINRIIDLNSPIEASGRDRKEQEAILETLNQSIRKTIQESIRVDIQKTVATEMSKQR